MKLRRPQDLKTRPSVSIVIPHFNYGRYLPTAVESALTQDHVDVEVIIVDDSSTDGSQAVARGLTERDQRIILVEHSRNLGHIRTYNDGLARASGDYLVLLSADDALTPNSLTRAVALLEAHSGVGMAYGRVRWFEASPPVLPPPGRRVWWEIWRGTDWIKRVAYRGRNIIVNPEVVLRRTIYEEIGGYDPRWPHAGDMYMWLQAAALGDVGFVGGPCQAMYRSHGANMHLTEFGALLDDFTQVRDVYKHFFDQQGGDLRGLLPRSMDAVAREALLYGALLTAEGQPKETLEVFQGFARRTSPGIVDSTTWKYAARATGGAGGVQIRMVESLRWRFRSRRTDLIGL